MMAAYRQRFDRMVAKSGKTLTPEETEAEWQKYWAVVRERSRMVAEDLAKRHGKLVLVGTVVDQYGKPVAGATVKGYAHSEPMVGKLIPFVEGTDKRFASQADAAGKFVVEAKSALWITVEAVEAPGCQYYPEVQTVIRFYVDREAAYLTKSWNLNEHHEPATFEVWRLVGQPERLCLGETRWDDDCSLPTRQGLLFTESRLLPAIKIASDTANVDLLIDMLPNPKDFSGETALLRATAPPGGGVAPGNWFEFFAPEDKCFKKSVEFVVRDNDQPCVFLRARRGQSFAKIRFDVTYSDETKRMAVALEYYLNPWGSRNLQLGSEVWVEPDELDGIYQQQAEKAAKAAGRKQPGPATPAPPAPKAKDQEE